MIIMKWPQVGMDRVARSHRVTFSATPAQSMTSFLIRFATIWLLFESHCSQVSAAGHERFDCGYCVGIRNKFTSFKVYLLLVIFLLSSRRADCMLNPQKIPICIRVGKPTFQATLGVGQLG
jgi:hypothetical protein